MNVLPNQNEQKADATGLLISVRNCTEASIALASGVDVLDIKEPERGSLGMPDIATVKDILNVLPKSQCVSLALGELNQFHNPVAEPFLDFLSHDQRINFVKLGLARMNTVSGWQQRWACVFEALPNSIVPVAVIYADQKHSGSPKPMEIVKHAKRLNCGAVLVDTFNKTMGNVFSHCDVHQLVDIRNCVIDQGMKFVLAGSVDVDCLASAVDLRPNLIGVRGAVCQLGIRQAQLSATAIGEFKHSLNRMMEISILN